MVEMKKVYNYVPLAQRVIVTAVINTYLKNGKQTIFDWSCYIDSVTGNNHEEEFLVVALYGDKIAEELGRMLFPNLRKYKYRS